MELKSVVCAVDISDEGLIAADRAARLVAPDGALTLFSVEETAVVGTGLSGYATAVVVPYTGAAAEAVARAGDRVASLHAVTRTVALEGLFEPTLLKTLKEEQADLVVVGTHGTGRMAGILLGSKATYVLHDAPCSVLIARGDAEPERWPRSIVAGVDGSPSSYQALEAARALAGRFGATLEPVMSTYRHSVEEIAAARGQVPELRLLSDGSTVDAIVDAAQGADLLVLGSRGLKGLKSLGSVSERVTHASETSVLVVRSR